MPAGTPDAALLWNGEVSFFSIDTNLIQSAGYRFDDGQLNQLPKQLPKAMRLLLPDIVVREIVNHRMKSVFEAVQQLEGAAEQISRTASIDMGAVKEHVRSISIEERAACFYESKVQEYVDKCGGEILDVSEASLAARIFDLYFKAEPPFAVGKNKKEEFPDAACLLVLEDYARDAGLKVIVASADDGWRAFAERSEFIYYVKSIDEMTALFAQTDELSKEVELKVFASVDEVSSFLHGRVINALEEHVQRSVWDVRDIYSGVAERVEGSFSDARFRGYSVEQEKTRSWVVDGDPTSWVVEMTVLAAIKVNVDVTFYAWDSIDQDEVEICSGQVTRDCSERIELYIELSNVVPKSEPKDWAIEIDTGYGRYKVDVGEVNPEFYD